MEDILLPLDKVDPGRSSASSRKMRGVEECGNNKDEELHHPLTSKSSDSSCNSGLDLYKPDSATLFNEESAPSLSVENNSAKPKLSSAFMISSLLDTKSPISNNSSQSSNTNQICNLKVTANAKTDGFVKTFETKLNTIDSNTPNKSKDSAANDCLDILKENSPLELTNGQVSDTFLDFPKHTIMDMNAEPDDVECDEYRVNVRVKTTFNKQDVEGMQFEITSLPQTDNMDSVIDISVASTKDVNPNVTFDGETVSTQRPDSHSKSGCNDWPGACEESDKHQELHVTHQDGNTHIKSLNSDSTSYVDVNTLDIQITRTVADNSLSGAAIEDSVTGREVKKIGQGGEQSHENSALCVKDNELSNDSKTSSGNSGKCTQNSSSSEKSSSLVKGHANKSLASESQKPTSLRCNVNEIINAEPSTHSKTSEINVLNTLSESEGKTLNFLGQTRHSKQVKDGFRNYHDTDSLGSSQARPSSKSEVAKKKVKLEDEDTTIKSEIKDKIKIEPLLQVKQEPDSETPKAEPHQVVDGSESVSSSAPKYTFKNILLMPKDNVSFISQKNAVIKERYECLKSEDKVSPNKQLATVSIVMDKIEEKLNPGNVALITKADSIDSDHNKESANERKRSQKGGDSSSPKRSKLDSLNAKEEKATDAETPLSGTKDSDDKQKSSSLTLSSEALQSLITLRVRTFIKNKKQANLDRLHLRTRGMQSASNLWKETAKHLERSVLELSALNQKLESRKAHLLAVKRLASRSIGVQASEESGNSTGSTANVTPSLSANPAQRSQQPVTPSPVIRTGRPGRPPLYHRPVSNITTTPSPVAAPAEKIILPPASKMPSTKTQENSVNLIDLTDDEDTSRTVAVKASTPKSLPVNHSGNKLITGGKTASVPGNGYVQPGRTSQGTSGTSSNQITQPPVPQHLVPGNVAAGSQYQLVTNNLTTQHSGTAHAQVSGPTLANTSRVLPQPSAPATASPAASASTKTTPLALPPSFLISNKHPAPLPFSMDNGNAPPTAKKRPPQPSLKITRVAQGIVLSWNMPPLSDVEKIMSYQLYAYQESDTVTPRSSLWKKVGEVNALPLPMACTLTQFQEGNKYHFAVRAVDQYGRCGSYSDPSSIYLGSKT